MQQQSATLCDFNPKAQGVASYRSPTAVTVVAWQLACHCPGAYALPVTVSQAFGVRVCQGAPNIVEALHGWLVAALHMADA